MQHAPVQRVQPATLVRGVSAPTFQEPPTPTPAPGGGDTFVTNNYYGIACGDAATPCHVVIDGQAHITSTEPLLLAPITGTVDVVTGSIYIPTGTIAVTNTAYTPLSVVPTMTPVNGAALLGVIVLFGIFYGPARDQVRLILAATGLICCLLVVLTGAPHYAGGFLLVALALAWWEGLLGAISFRGNR